ncbi:toprim domain-containing protein [Paenibacillus sp. SC116]|uniref:toprim domain-containing protein n=1 Tax=Paenibacillus sp. SC116 TaxID=2968986 RepID=UPI00215AC004|nr:toprim domain-containing protein [Paenibacillus sp. SC116]MCR8843132.1 toprim domain-containing protein [Paenibacillus sp. SC116]
MIQTDSILLELSRYHWIKPNWSADKLTSSSPMRSGDSSASFYVWLEDNPRFNARAGDWGDSGAVDDEWRRGSFTKLLAFLRNETEEETREYLRYTYATEWSSEEELTFNPPKLTIESVLKPLDKRILEEFAYRHPYLERRGISDVVQRYYQVGFDRVRQAVAIPWFDANGRLCNVLYRSVNSKVFWYHDGGWPIRSMLFGIDVIYKRKVKRAALVEAPIDALYLATCGIPTAAVGGAIFNTEKRDLIIRSGIEELTIFHDNDGGAGVELRDKVTAELTAYVDVRHVEYPEGRKDPSDVGCKLTINEMYGNRKQVRESFRVAMK